MNVPDTSTTLLREISLSPHAARWSEFVERYRPFLESYLASHFLGLDCDDLIQETFIALIHALPNYHYAPDETGHFRNYLIGTIRHKALRSLRREGRREAREKDWAALPDGRDNADEWRDAILEIALSQLLSDETLLARSREVFRRVAVNGEKPEIVAAELGIERNAIDQIRSRLTAKLKKIVSNLEANGT